MSLAITLIVALVLLLLGFVGAWRSIQSGVLALGATLFGIVLSGLWGERWGNDLAGQLDTAPAPIIFVVSSLLLTSMALLLGYGGAVLLPAAAGLLTWQRRVLGGVLGLLNGIVLTGSIIRFSTRDNPGFAELIASFAPLQLLYAGLPLLFLALAAGGSTLVIGQRVLATLRKRTTIPSNAPSAQAASAAPPSSTALPISAEQRENQQRALEKINDRLR